MRPVVQVVLSLSALLGAAPLSAAAAADPSATVAALSRTQPSQSARDDAEQQARWFYSTLTGEIAARTGHPELAYTELLRAARDMNSPALFERAVQVALAAQRPDHALAAVGMWRDLQPDSVRAQAWRVQLLLGMGRDGDAAAAVSRLLAMTPQPQRPAAVLALGGMLEGMHDAARALALSRRSLAPYASLPQAQVVIGLMQVRAGDVTGGVARAARALRADPSLRPAAMLLVQHYTVDPPRADSLLAAYLAANDDDDSLRMLWVDAAAGQQRASVALTQCEALARRQPGLAQVWLLMGSLRQQLGQARRAEQDLARFLALSLPGDAWLHHMVDALGVGQPQSPPASAPASPAAAGASAPAPAASAARSAPPEPSLSRQELARVYLALSQLALEQSQVARAAQWLQRIPDAQHGPAEVLQRAKVLVAQGHAQQAVALVQDLPRDSSAQRRQRLLALAELLQDLHEPARAFSVLESGMRAWGRQADFAYETAMAAGQAGRTARMDELLRRIVQEHRDYQPALNALGYSLADQGRELDHARGLILRALRLSPGNPFVLDSLGWAEFRLGRTARAQTLLEQALAGRDDPAIAAHLAQVLWRRGQHARATELLRQAWRDAPKDPGVREAMRRLGVKF